jgi:nucleotidyltransferase/DNA polymerase involved in DNA repair
MSARVVLHCDVDGFYVACELLRRPELRGLPLAVTQFNSGGFVAVSEEARQQGVGKGDGIGAGGQKALDYFKDRPDALMSGATHGHIVLPALFSGAAPVDQ